MQLPQTPRHVSDAAAAAEPHPGAAGIVCQQVGPQLLQLLVPFIMQRLGVEATHARAAAVVRAALATT